MKNLKFIILLLLFSCSKEEQPIKTYEVEFVVSSSTGGLPNAVNTRFNGVVGMQMRYKGVKGDVVEVYEVGGRGHLFDAYAYVDGDLVKESHGQGLYIKIEL